MTRRQQNEQDHYDALAKVLGEEAPKDLTFTYPTAPSARPRASPTTGAGPRGGLRRHLHGRGHGPDDNGLKEVAAQIGANEAQHLTTLKSLAAGGTLVPNPSLPKVLTAAEATAAVTPFLG